MLMLTYYGLVNCRHGIDFGYLNSRYLKQTKVHLLHLFTETVSSSFDTLDLEKRVTESCWPIKANFISRWT